MIPNEIISDTICVMALLIGVGITYLKTRKASRPASRQKPDMGWGGV